MSAASYIAAAARRSCVDPWLGAFVVAEAAAGLACAHELRTAVGELEGCVHRDVSPQNVFVTTDGQVKLLDFGVARVEDRLTKTVSGVIKGKFAYMAPEQLRRGVLDQRSDLFALGIVLYELTTGRRLFYRSNEAAVLRAVLEEPIAPPSAACPNYPPALEAVCLRALARDPEHRFESARAMRAALIDALREHRPEIEPAVILGAQIDEWFEPMIARQRELLADHRPRVGLDRPRANGDEPRTRAVIATKADPILDAPGDATTLFEDPARDRTRRLLPGVAVVSALAALAVTWLAPERSWPDAADVVAPTTIEVAIDSDPAGAHAVIGERSCETPCRLRIARADDTATLEVRHGPSSLTREFRANRDVSFVVAFRAGQESISQTNEATAGGASTRAIE